MDAYLASLSCCFGAPLSSASSLAEPSTLVADCADAVHRLEHGPIDIDDNRIRRNHGREPATITSNASSALNWSSASRCFFMSWRL